MGTEAIFFSVFKVFGCIRFVSFPHAGFACRSCEENVLLLKLLCTELDWEGTGLQQWPQWPSPAHCN